MEINGHMNQNYRQLRTDEIKRLEARRCTAQDWETILVRDPFDVERVAEVDFAGTVSIGLLSDDATPDDISLHPPGLYRARIANCRLGDGVRVANIAGHLAGYHIGDRAVIENVGTMECLPDSAFGGGVEVAVLNEAGGREVPLFTELSAQFAHLICCYRYRAELVRQLQRMAAAAARDNRRDFAIVGEAAQVTGSPRIVGVDIGPFAIVDAVQSLVNGTILSCRDAPAILADAVIARDFIVAEGAQVTGAAVLDKTFVGQASRVGKQFSAENCLLMANCEAFHGEGCSVLAGPYTVTHHKSTLLIGGAMSFFNAGSATNQSNHRYKLGPTHEGKLERGCKTGSSSYLMWPGRVGPFSVVLGKHTRSFDTADLPFSHLEADASGRCELIPGHYIATVGTLRDGSKWPSRDRRKAPLRRDVISFDVFSPFTIGRMQRGLALLDRLKEQADRAVETVTTGGVEIKRVLLRTGRKRYAACIERYLLEQIVIRIEKRLPQSPRTAQELVGFEEAAVYSEAWCDVGGQLMPRDRLGRLWDAVESGEIETIEQLRHRLQQIHDLYEEDVWVWVRHQAADTGLSDLANATSGALQDVVGKYATQHAKFLRLVLIDAQREYDEASHTGFGVDGGEGDRERDFAAVRGELAENSFVKSLMTQIEELPDRCDRIVAALAELA